MKKTCEEFSAVSSLLKDVLESRITLPARATIIGLRNWRKIVDEISDYTEKKNELIQKYGSLDEEKGVYSIPASDVENSKKFQEEIKEFADVEMEIDVQMIPIDTFDGEYPTNVIMAFEFMIEE